MKKLIIIALVVSLIAVACGGISDADKTATAVVSTATAEAQATATALEALASDDPNVQSWITAYDDLSDAMLANLDADGISKAFFVEAISSQAKETGPTFAELRDIVRTFEAIGDLEVTFLSQHHWLGIFFLPPSTLQVTGISAATVSAFQLGSAFPTGHQAARLTDVFYQYGLLERCQGLPNPNPPELVGFFADLPPEVKAELEANGWTEERINAFIEGDEVPTVEDIRSLYGPLSDVPIPPLAAFVNRLLNQFHPVVLETLIEEIGQQTFDELTACARAPTGSEFLALIEFLESP